MHNRSENMTYRCAGAQAIKVLAFSIVMALTSSSVLALEINGTVSKVDAGDWVVIRLPVGAAVAEGDDVRIKAKLPNIGFIAIKTHWRVTKTTNGKAMAIPVGKPTGKPQIGYRAVIETSARQPVIPAAPVARGPAPVHECDRLAAHEADRDAVAKPVDFNKIQEYAVIGACTKAVRQYPDTSRFLTQLGRGLLKSGQKNRAFAAFKKSVDMGSAQGMAFLAIMYKKGWGTRKDLSRALYWFNKSAENGNIGGMVFAASMYFYGEGGPGNYQMAAKWYSRAAKEGYSPAMFSLSNMVDRGQGVRRDPARAARLMLLAMQKGSKEARDTLISNPGNLSLAMRKEVQNTLARKGYYDGPIDGKFGSGTKRAIRNMTGK